MDKIQKSMENFVFNEVSLVLIASKRSTGIYKELTKESNQSNGKVLKAVFHDEMGHINKCKQLKKEFQVMHEIKHPYIISVKDCRYFSNVRHRNQSFCGFEMELAYNDLNSIIHQILPDMLSISAIQSIFYKISIALYYLHNKVNIVHNDIKLENILIKNNNLDPKLADFQFARHFNIEHKDFKKFWANRSKINLAPEINELLSQNEDNNLEEIKTQSKQIIIDEKKTDVFALGVALFQCLFNTTPFMVQADSKDELYQYIAQEQYEQFWSHALLQEKVKILNEQQQLNMESLQELLINMLHYKVNKRYTITQVYNHPWMDE